MVNFQLTSALDNNDENTDFIQNEKAFLPESDEINKVKTGHVLTELLSTEKVYVSELHTIVQVGSRISLENYSRNFIIVIFLGL